MSYRRRGDKHQSSHSSRHTGVDDRLSALDIDPLVLGLRPNDVHLGSQMDDCLMTIDRGQHRKVHRVEFVRGFSIVDLLGNAVERLDHGFGVRDPLRFEPVDHDLPECHPRPA